jgi:hypothetical protein
MALGAGKGAYVFLLAAEDCGDRKGFRQLVENGCDTDGADHMHPAFTNSEKYCNSEARATSDNLRLHRQNGKLPEMDLRISLP